MQAPYNKEYLQELAHKMKSGPLTAEEQTYFDSWYNSHADDLLELPEGYAPNPLMIRDRMLARLKQRIKTDKAKQGRIIPLRWTRIAAAASVILCLGLGIYYAVHKNQPPSAIRIAQDIAPGKNQATLTLAGGRRIVLTNSLHGQIAVQGNTTIQAKAGGAITYNAGNAETHITYNTLSTTRGQQSPVPLVLADGTRVWLNAASSITFPTAFNAANRSVNITGEVYFEVVHNEHIRPLQVIAKKQMLEDVGTHFNINAYDDEPVIKTTLLEGSVKVFKDGQTVLLKPGQQSIAGSSMSIKDADTEEVVAWKNGYFRFNGEHIEGIMRQLSRWYNVDVQYNGKILTEGFYGKISRTKNISDVLKMLEETNSVRFKVEGRRVTVMP